MSAAPAVTFITIEDYLAKEEAASEKHEYYKGEVFTMAGASINHNRIVRNALLEIGNYLNGKSCEVFPGDVRIYIEVNTLFTYPDLTIFCDEIERFENRTDTALNPTAIIEVLSKSTQEYDRGTKFNLYRQIPSLKEYLMISSTEVLVEKYTKQSDTEWLFTAYEKAEDFYMLESVGLTVEVKSLYRNVSFEKELTKFYFEF